MTNIDSLDNETLKRLEKIQATGNIALLKEELEKAIEKNKLERMKEEVNSKALIEAGIKKNNTQKEKIKRVDAALRVDHIYEMLGGDEGCYEFFNDPDHKERKMAFYTKIWSKRVPQAVEVSGSEDNDTPINIYVPAAALDV